MQRLPMQSVTRAIRSKISLARGSSPAVVDLIASADACGSLGVMDGPKATKPRRWD